MRTASLAAALLAAVLATTSARADGVAVTAESDGTATVTLTNGALYHGTLIERIQGDHVTLRLVTGEVKTFAWAELAPAEVSAPPPPPPAKPLEAPGVLVTLTGDEGVHLERVTGTETGGFGSYSDWGSFGGRGRGGMSVLFGSVCEAPCNVRIDSSYVYRVAGPGYTSTHTFQVSGNAARIDAHMGSMAQRVLGWVVFAGGLVAGTVGFGGGWACSYLPNCTTTGWFIAGGVGLAASVAGLVMVLTSGSSVEVNGQPVAFTPRGLVF